jgi:Spy/CpxP family protein refolding chaperone
MKNKFFIIVLVFLFIINITALATFSYNRWLRPGPTAGQQEPSETLQALPPQMSLTPEQSKMMKNQRIFFEEDIESIRLRMGEKRNAILEEIRNPSPNLKHLDRLIEELGGLQADIQKKSVRHLLKDKELLTPWQQERYFSLFEEHVEGRGMRFRRKGAGRQGPRWQREN